MTDNTHGEADNSSEEARIKERLGELFVNALLSHENEGARSRLAQGLAKDIEAHLAASLQSQESALTEQRKAEFASLEQARSGLLTVLENASTSAQNRATGASASGGLLGGIDSWSNSDDLNDGEGFSQAAPSATRQNILEKSAPAEDSSASLGSNINLLWGAITVLAMVATALAVLLYLTKSGREDTANASEIVKLCEELRAEDGATGEVTDADVLGSALAEERPAEGQENAGTENATAPTDPRADLMARLEAIACPVENNPEADETVTNDPVEPSSGTSPEVSTSAEGR